MYPERNGGLGHCPFGVIGLSYRTAGIDLRGRASFDAEKTNRLLGLLREHGVSEALVLSTCNRTEVYFAGPDHDLVMELFAVAANTPLEEIRPHLYMKKSLCAACHLFRIVSGLDSAVLGETEIVAQVKQAWRMAEESGACGPGLGLLLQRSMEVGKRVRTETDLCRGVTSTATLAIIKAQQKLGSLEGRNVVVIGAGQIAERVSKELHPLNLGSLKVLNRSLEKAEQLTRLHGGIPGTLENLRAEIADADVVIGAVRTAKPIIDDSLIPIRSQPLLLIDLGVPANFALESEYEGVELLNIDGLSAMCSQNLDRRASAVPVALDLLEEELKRLRSDLTMRTAGPTIKALVNQAEQIRRLNVDWALDRLTGLNDKERKIVEDLSNRIIKGMLQAPIEGLKHELAAAEHREIVSKLFRLPRAEDEESADERLVG
jgi:glutamyl-tRNA reductase